MKVINSNATTALFDMLEGLSESPHESWRCVYLKPINANDIENEPHSAANARAITAQLTKIPGTIYLCEDGDIIILFQRAPQQIVGKICSYLGDATSSFSKNHHTYNLFGVFDLGKHWQGFHSLCVNKYLRVIARQEERHMPVAVSAVVEPAISNPTTYPLIAAN